MMGATSTSETSVKFYQITRRNIPEDNHVHTCSRENLKCHSWAYFSPSFAWRDWRESWQPRSGSSTPLRTGVRPDSAMSPKRCEYKMREQRCLQNGRTKLRHSSRLGAGNCARSNFRTADTNSWVTLRKLVLNLSVESNEHLQWPESAEN
jgi:hypothetical protein